MTIETYGTGERLRIAAALAHKIEPKHLVLLPIPTTKDKIYINKTDIPLIDTLDGVGEGSVVVGYGIPGDYKDLVHNMGADVIDLEEDEDFLCENARLTAIGTLGYLLSTSKKEPKDLCFGIIGYGRIGSRLAEMLLFFGARVKVYTSKEATCIFLGKYGIESAYVAKDDGYYDFSGLDIIINTAEKDMTESFPLGKISDGVRVIELASGDNFIGVNGVERLPSIPEKAFAESSARAYFDRIKKFYSARGEA